MTRAASGSASSGRGSAAGPGAGGGGGGEQGSTTFGTGRVSVPCRSTGVVCHCCGAGEPGRAVGCAQVRGQRLARHDRLLREGALLRRRERGLDRRRRLRAVVVEALREIEEHLLGVDAARERLQPDVPAADDGRHVVGQLEAEAALAQPRELLEGEADAAADRLLARVLRQRAEARVGGGRRRREGGDDEPLEEHDRPVAALHLDRQVARLLAEGDDLDDVEEGQVLEIPLKGQSASPGGFYTAARISPATLSSGTTR